MPNALFRDFLQMKRGDTATFHKQELNPPDRSQVMLLEIQWTHECVEGDLVFGSMDISGVGSFDIDAYICGRYAIGRPDNDEQAWLSPTNVPGEPKEDRLRRLTGGPMRTAPLKPSEMSTPSGPRIDEPKYSGPAVVCFSRDEYQMILQWQNGMAEKGFNCCFSNQSYVHYKRAVGGGMLSSYCQKGGLDGHIEIRRERRGLFASAYSISASDGSFRSPESNPKIVQVYASSTQFLYERSNSFSTLIALMDQAVDKLLERNQCFVD
jgi:hypothetical protein